MMCDVDWVNNFAELAKQVRRHLEAAPGCHDFDHTQRVLRNAELRLPEWADADVQVVRFASLLHDIARPEELAMKGEICHAALGAKLAAQLLRRYDLPEAFVCAVADAVEHHRYRSSSPPTTVEARIVYDADKLDSLGATGVGRAFLFAGRVGARLHNTSEEAFDGEAYGREDTAYREFLVKLRYLPSQMLTTPGRRLAAERLKVMEAFFEQLNREVYG